jgi:predicted nucleic acid-binding protein
VILPDAPPYLEETNALDPGEASAITLAWQNRESSLLIIAEKRGRRVSSALGLTITGTAGVLTDAAAAGLVPFEEIFQRLAQTQFRLSAAIVEQLRQRYQSPPPQ